MARLAKLEAGAPLEKEDLPLAFIKLVASTGSGRMRPEGEASNTVTCLGMDGELRLMDGETEEELIERAKQQGPADGHGLRRLILSWEG